MFNEVRAGTIWQAQYSVCLGMQRWIQEFCAKETYNLVTDLETWYSAVMLGMSKDITEQRKIKSS